MKRFFLRGILVFLAVSGFHLVGICHATVGGPAGSVDSDIKALSARSLGSTPHAGYTVREIGYHSIKVREYISPSGIVFAIAWNGFVRPDLSILLGPYAEQYKAALEQMPRRHGMRRSETTTPGIVVQQWGHMRNLQGRAYVPDLMPPGVSADEIK